MTKIIGTANPGKGGPCKVKIDGEWLDPGPSQAIINHSPDGFNWGYGGSGPAQLALAIMLEVVGKETALKYYQAFKWQFVATWPSGQDFNEEILIDEWVKAQERYQNDKYPMRGGK